jgi:chorismate-pyruvate lyase
MFQPNNKASDADAPGPQKGDTGAANFERRFAYRRARLSRSGDGLLAATAPDCSSA